MSFAKTRISLAVLAAVSVAVPAGAQALDEVVISSSRAQQRSFDTPAAIQAVERDTIQNAGPQVNLSESLNRVPGLTILNRQNYAQDLQVSIRGFGARAAFGIRGIRLLIDGIPATTPDGQGQGSSVSLTSAERIEVLRGPLALMYGNSAGGVIQAFTREAPESPEATVQYYGGSYGMHRTDWQYAGRVGSVGVVADYATFDTNGFRDHSTTERKQFNSKIAFGPDAGTRVNVVFNHFDMPLAQDPQGLTAAQLAQDATQAGTNSVLRRVRKITSQSQVGTSLTHALGADHSVTARLYTGRRDNLQYLASNNWVGLGRDYYGAGVQYNQQSRVGDTPVRWVAGYEYDQSKERRQGGSATNGEKTAGSLTRDEDNKSENSDLFVQATALVSERWSLIGGLRHSSVRLASEDFYFGDGKDGSGSISYQATNPVLGATWHAADNLNVYANYGRGFESPTLVEVAYIDTGTAVSPTFNTGLNAAISRHYEAGMKWLPSPRSRVDFAVYLIDTTDELVVSRSSFGQSAYMNAPGTRRTGWELAGRTLLSANWRASLAASAIDARFSSSFSNVVNGTTYTIASGNVIPGIPQHFVFGELMWASRSFEASAIANRTGMRAGVELVGAGRLYANDTNTAFADGYTTLNLKASHGWAMGGKGSLTAYGRLDNVTDQRYVGSVIVNQSASQFYEPAPGFNWTLGLRLDVPL